jgi:hypothetical protein
MRMTPESQLGCPSYIAWGRDGGPPPLAELPGFGEGSIDREATRKRRATGPAEMCCYHWWEPCPGGRPLVDDGRTVLPEVRGGAATHGLGSIDPVESVDELDASTREALASAWLADARAEHASVASFARASIELLAVGAPLALVAATQRASLDEVRHAERCFALASRYAGRTLEAGALEAVAPRATDIARVARDTFEEGCVAETLASLAAQRALAGCEDDAVRATLAEIADDEADHAALAWATLAWAIRAGGLSARDAVCAAADDARRRILDDGAAGPATDQEAARHGRLCVAAQHEARRESWVRIVEPLLTEVLAV